MKKSTSKSTVTLEDIDTDDLESNASDSVQGSCAKPSPSPYHRSSPRTGSASPAAAPEQLPAKVQSLLSMLNIPFGSQFGKDKDVDPTMGLLLFAVEVISALRDVVRLYKQKDSVFAKSVGSRLVAALTGEIGKLVIYSLTNDWGEEIELSKCFHAIGKRILKLFPEMTTRKHKVSGKMLIHHTCLKSHSALSVDYINTLLEICPSSVSSSDAHGALPIHWCLRNKYPNVNVLRLLVDKYPKGPCMRDSKGFIPLHWAVHQTNPNFEIIEELLRVYPQGARDACGTGGLPLHWAVNHETPSLEIVQLLDETYPDAIRTPCKEGLLPLHRAVDRSNPNIDVVAYLIDRYPDGLRQSCRFGQYPLHKAMDHASPDSLPVISLLLELFPAAARVSDQDGYLPLHVCLDTRKPDEELVEQLLQAFPDAARRPTVDGLLPLHMAVGTNISPSLRILQQLMGLHPLGCQQEVVDYVPKDDTANASTWQGEWIETRWTPLTRAIERGLDGVVSLFRDILEEQGLLVVDSDTGEYYIHYHDTVDESRSGPTGTNTLFPSGLDVISESSGTDTDGVSESHQTQIPPTWLPLARSKAVGTGNKDGIAESSTSPDQTPVRLRPMQAAVNPRMVRTSPLYGGRLPHPNDANDENLNGQHNGSNIASSFTRFRHRLFGHSQTGPATSPPTNRTSAGMHVSDQHDADGRHHLLPNPNRVASGSVDVSDDSWEETYSVRTFSSFNSNSSMTSMRSLMMSSNYDEDHANHGGNNHVSVGAVLTAKTMLSVNSPNKAVYDRSPAHVKSPSIVSSTRSSKTPPPATSVTSKSPSSLSKLLFKIPNYINKTLDPGSHSNANGSAAVGGSGTNIYGGGIATKPSRLSDRSPSSAEKKGQILSPKTPKSPSTPSTPATSISSRGSDGLPDNPTNSFNHSLQNNRALMLGLGKTKHLSEEIVVDASTSLRTDS
jgi:hypothetical protein